MEDIKCAGCPWLAKGQPLITEELRKACHDGLWFCCHENMGTCEGAKLEHDKNERLCQEETKVDGIS